MRRWPSLGVAAIAVAALLAACGGEEQGGTPTATPAATAAGTAAPIGTATARATPKATATPQSTPQAMATPTPTPTAAAARLGKLAFARQGDIRVLDLDSGQERRLTTDAGAQAPRWSPDGQWVAFYEVQTLDLWVVGADGSGATQVAQSAAGGATWAPNDNRLAYADAEGAVTVVDVESGQRQQVLAPGKQVGRFAWFPDGRRLVLEVSEWAEQGSPGSGPPRGQGLWLVNADGTGLTELRSVFVPNSADLGTISPDGRWLTLWEGMASASLRADGLPLRTMPATGGEAQEVAAATLLKPGFVVWSPEADRLAVVEGAGRQVWANRQIVVMRPDGSDRRILSDAGRADLSPAWSPDGRRLAFASVEALPLNTPYQQAEAIVLRRRIWSVNADSSDKRQLTNDIAYADQFPQWSADGSHIMFVRQPTDAAGLGGEEAAPVEIWLMRADGTDQRAVATGLSESWYGYYGVVDWNQVLDWHR